MSADSRPARVRVAELAWVRVPRRVCRRSVLLGVALADGGYLRAWPQLGPLLLPAAGIVGVLIGAGHPDDLYSYSLLLTTLLAAVSSLGASLGVWALVGFVVGDLTLARLGESTQLSLGLNLDGLRALSALMVTYVVLAGLLVLVPLLAGVGRIAISERLAGRSWGSTVASAALVAISAGLAFLWTQSTPFLIRPVWGYFDLSPEVDAIEPLQQRGWILALAVAIVVGGRLLLERAGSWTPARDSWVAGSRPAGQASWWLAAVGRSIFVTLMLSGMLASLIAASVTFLAVLGVSVLHLRVLPALAAYVRAVQRVPLAIRMVVVPVTAYLLGVLIVEGARDRGSNSFASVIVATVLSLLVVALLFPHRPGRPAASARLK